MSQQCAQLIGIKEIRPEYEALYSQVLQDVLHRVDKAFKAFFRRVKSGHQPGYPRYKSGFRYASLTYPQTGFGIDAQGKLSLSKVGHLKMVQHRPLTGVVKTCTITTTTTSTGKWYVCFACDELQANILAPSEEHIGIDVGLKSFAYLSTGDQITPLDRPAQFGSRLNITPQEAAALEGAEAARDQKLNRPTDPDKQAAPPVGGDRRNPNATFLERLFEGGGGSVGGYNNFWLAPGSKVISVNGEKRSSIIVDPPDGQVPQMKPEAARRNAAYLRGAVSPDASESAAGPASAYDNPESRPLAERCLLGFGSTSGPPDAAELLLQQPQTDRADHKTTS